MTVNIIASSVIGRLITS